MLFLFDETPRMKGPGWTILKVLGVLVALVSAIVLGLGAMLIFLFRPLREPMSLSASPDGRHLVRLISVNPGAMSSYFFDLEIEDLDGHRTPLVEMSQTMPIFRWRSAHELVVENANRDTVVAPPHPPDVQVVFRNLEGDLYYK